MQKYFSLFLILSTIGGVASAATLEERVTQLERDVATLKGAPGTIAYYQRGTNTYAAAGDCAKITDKNRYYKSDLELKIVKRVVCPGATYVIATSRTPEGYEGAGNLKIDAFLESDLVIP